MKRIIQNYVFNKTAKTVTFSDFASVSLANVVLITNSTSNTIIYNFAVSGSGGSVVGNTLTLSYDTTSMANTDRLQIIYDDPAWDANPAASVLLNERAMDTLQAILSELRSVRIAFAAIACEDGSASETDFAPASDEATFSR